MSKLFRRSKLLSLIILDADSKIVDKIVGLVTFSHKPIQFNGLDVTYNPKTNKD